MSTAPATAPLVTRTVRVADPGPLLALLPRDNSLAWVRRGEGLVGWGQALRLRFAGARPVRRTPSARWQGLLRHAVVRDEVGLPGTGPVAFGSFAFSPRSPAGGVLVVPEVVVGHRDGQWWLTTISLGAGASRRPSLPDPGADDRCTARWPFADGAMSAPEWRGRRRRGHPADHGRRGGQGRAGPRPATSARSGRSTSARLLGRLAERYPGTWTFSVDGLVGATPEMLVRRDKGMVTSRVLAGTIRRTGDDARDLALAASLARSSKDLEEHEYAVRSVADALAPRCTSMNVPESPFVLHLANVMHLATDVTGVLRDDATSPRPGRRPAPLGGRLRHPDRGRGAR